MFMLIEPNARIEVRGRTDSQKTSQSVTPRPLERRVGLPRWRRKPGLLGFLLFFIQPAQYGLHLLRPEALPCK